MTGLSGFLQRMNLLLWLAVIFLFHLILYLTLNTDDWLFATLSATLVYALVLGGLKFMVRRKNRGVH